MTQLQSSDSDSNTSPYYLATTALDEFWDKSAKVVFLGEWCRRYSKAEAWHGLDAEVIPDLWSDPQRRADAYHRINELYERVLPRLGARLNEVHGISHGNQYWRLVIGHWLYYYISTLFDRHAHLVCAIEQYPAIKTVVLSSECHVTPKNSLDVMAWNMADSYNLQTYSRILEVLGRGDFPHVKIRQELPTGVTGRSGVRARFTFCHAQIFYASAGPGWSWRVVLHKSYFSRSVEFLLAVKSGWRVLPSFFLGECAPDVAIDRQMRQRLMDDPLLPGDEFEAVLAKLLPYDIPQCFVEGYGFVAEQARIFPVAPRAIFSSIAGHLTKPSSSGQAHAPKEEPCCCVPSTVVDIQELELIRPMKVLKSVLPTATTLGDGDQKENVAARSNPCPPRTWRAGKKSLRTIGKPAFSISQLQRRVIAIRCRIFPDILRPTYNGRPDLWMLFPHH